MTGSESLLALRNANPRTKPGFAETVDSATRAIGELIAGESHEVPASSRGVGRPTPRRRLTRVSALGASLAAAALAAAFFLFGSLGGGTGLESATAAVQKAAAVSAASAERSGTATIRITDGGELWVATTVRWHGNDMSLARDRAGAAAERPGKVGTELIVVDGLMYSPDPESEGGWLEIGSPASIDPDSGTTPDEYLAAVREDVVGATLRRVTRGMRGPTTTELPDGSTVYSGTIASGLIARETGFKEGEALRVLPFGYVAHGDAGDPGAPLDIAVTVGAEGLVRRIAVTWGKGASAWEYVVSYSGLGTTPAPVAPANARSLLDLRLGLGR